MEAGEGVKDLILQRVGDKSVKTGNSELKLVRAAAGRDQARVWGSALRAAPRFLESRLGIPAARS